uniref:Uncharacterized protein n=1 Tax=Populus trichocarpa TaxID=3694 RepID=A0A2K1Y7M2_POPTR
MQPKDPKPTTRERITWASQNRIQGTRSGRCLQSITEKQEQNVSPYIKNELISILILLELIKHSIPETIYFQE